MKPVSSNRSQNTGDPVSSNLVIWQGPPIPCIGLCTGDTISDVTAKLGAELCDLLTQTNITAYDLSCFNPVCPTLNNFNELIQFIIDRLCICCSTTTTSTELPPGTDCPDCIVDIAACFYYQTPLGDTITRMTIADYARAIGVKVCDLVSQIAVINSTLTSLQNQIDTLNGDVTNVGNRIDETSAMAIFSSCLISPIPVDGVSIEDFVTNLERAFCELRTVTGLPSALLQGILRQCTLLDTAPTLNLPGVNMGSLPGWVLAGSYSTVADAINNMWITICDMRAAIRSILDTCCPQGCEGLVINLQTTYTAPNINFFWTGDGTGFEDCNPAGSLITITDAYGNTYTTRIPIVAYINLTYTLDISGTPLNTGTNLSIHIEACFRKLSDNSTCERCIETTILNQSVCPACTIASDDSSVTYSFTNAIIGAVVYTISLRDAGNTLIDQHILAAGAPGLVSGVFNNGILPSTTYSVTLDIAIGGVTTNSCPAGVTTTEPLNCNPPVEVSAVADPII